MGKGKLRHDPDKPQNKLGAECQFAEFIPSCNFDGRYTVIYCMRGHSTKHCQGNPHKCKEAWYRWQACRSDRRKNIDGAY
jgi:hypothetical protein